MYVGEEDHRDGDRCIGVSQTHPAGLKIEL